MATNKMAQAKRWLADLTRTELEPADSRIFPGSYCPVMVVENGELIVMPTRYQCRPHGHPAFYDVKFPGTYNAIGTLLTVRTAQFLQDQQHRDVNGFPWRRSGGTNSPETRNRSPDHRGYPTRKEDGSLPTSCN
jgi:hypothetical protein